jgi:hypothetical protein
MTTRTRLVASAAVGGLTVALAWLAPADALDGGPSATEQVAARGATPSDGRIAFTDYGSGVLTTVNPDGSALVEVTDPATDGLVINRPAWMPAGKRLIYTASRNGGDFSLYSIREDGTGRRLMVPNHGGFFDFSPAVSPNARWLYFDRCRPDPPGGCGVFRARTTGKPRLQVVVPYPPLGKDFGVGFFAISASGKRLAFTRFNYRGIINQVWVGRADGSHARAVTKPAAELTVTSWTSRGWLVVNGPNAHPFNSVYLMRPDGGSRTLVAGPPLPHSDYFGAAAPSGTRLAFVSDVDFPDLSGTHVYAVDTDGSDLSLVDTGLDTVGAPVWGTAPLLPEARATSRSHRSPALTQHQRRALEVRVPAYLRGVLGPTR